MQPTGWQENIGPSYSIRVRGFFDSDCILSDIIQRRLDPGKETLRGFFQVGNQNQNLVIISFAHLEKINNFCLMRTGVAQKLSLPRPLEN